MPAYPLTTCGSCRPGSPCRICARLDAAYARKIEKHLSAGNVREAAEASSLPQDPCATPGCYVGTFGPSNAPGNATYETVCTDSKEAHLA